MTKILSELLGVPFSKFGVTVRQLEQTSGRFSHDIRLTTEITQRSRVKLRDLFLDTEDTTGQELYASLLLRFERDEKLARQVLGVSDNASADDIITAVHRYIEATDAYNRRVFALKTSVAKRLFKAVPPKKTMKQLKYRSLDSMLKHEDVSSVYIAAFFSETLAWRKKFLAQYNKLRPGDFETRKMRIVHPKSSRWYAFAAQAAQRYGHTMVIVKELGVVVTLPPTADVTGLALVNISFALGAMNDIASASSYMKMRQVQPDFGNAVRYVAEHEPMTTATLGDVAVPWRVLHQYYARSEDAYNAEIFEPHVQKSDLHWVHPESIIARLHDALEFWQDTRYTAQYRAGDSVSFNVFDVAINYCNGLPFAARTANFARQQLWQEFMLRYLSHEHVERAIAAQLRPAFASIDARP